MLEHEFWDSLQTPPPEDLPEEPLFERGRPSKSAVSGHHDVRRSGVDVLRLSQIAKRNLSEAYRQDQSQSEAPIDTVEDESDVILKTTDTELDFRIAGDYIAQGDDSRGGHGSSDGDRSSILEDDDLQQIDMNSDDGNDEGRLSRRNSDLSSIADEVDSNPGDEGVTTIEPEKHLQEPPPYEPTEGPSGNRNAIQPTHAWDGRNRQPTDSPASTNDPSSQSSRTISSGSRGDSGQDTSSSNLDVPNPLHWNDIFCPQDFAVKPIVLNTGIEQIKQPTYNEERLAFPALNLNRVLTLSSENLNEFLTKVFDSLKNSNSSEEKMNTLGYLYTLCFSSKFSNVLVNSPLVDLMLSMAKKSKVTPLVSRLLLVVGVLVRYSTLIRNSQVMKENGMLAMLTSLLREGLTAAPRPGYVNSFSFSMQYPVVMK